jgi:hypothetical protein
MHFKILGKIENIEVISKGRGICYLKRIKKMYGKGNWRKLKGIATIKLRNGKIKVAELHWYEAHGIGKKEIKRKRYL